MLIKLLVAENSKVSAWLNKTEMILNIIVSVTEMPSHLKLVVHEQDAPGLREGPGDSLCVGII